MTPRFPADFFATVARQHWLTAPGQWAQPFPDDALGEADIFEALLALRARLERGEQDVLPRVFSGDRPIGFSLDRHLPTPEDGDLAGFEARLRAQRSGPDTGIVIRGAAALTPRLWRRSVAFLEGLTAAVGFPAGGAHAEIFLGDYPRSFFGVHKDRLETFTFVMRGRKRFLLWPYEALAGDAGLPAEATLHAFNFDDLDYEPLRDGAQVLEGGPGDVFFWPASAWHVAEEAAPGFVITLTLALAPSAMLAAGSPHRIAAEGDDEAGRDGYAPLDPPLPPPVDAAALAAGVEAQEAALRRVLADPVRVASRRVAAMQWLSAWGFARGPDRGPLPRLARADRLCAVARIHAGEAVGDSLPCAVNGILLQSSPAFLPLVAALNAGGTFQVGALADRFGGGPDQPAADEIVEALAHLCAAHALLPADGGSWQPEAAPG